VVKTVKGTSQNQERPALAYRFQRSRKTTHGQFGKVFLQFSHLALQPGNPVFDRNLTHNPFEANHRKKIISF
jgi:hypothetical protein